MWNDASNCYMRAIDRRGTRVQRGSGRTQVSTSHRALRNNDSLSNHCRRVHFHFHRLVRFNYDGYEPSNLVGHSQILCHLEATAHVKTHIHFVPHNTCDILHARICLHVKQSSNHEYRVSLIAASLLSHSITDKDSAGACSFGAIPVVVRLREARHHALGSPIECNLTLTRD